MAVEEPRYQCYSCKEELVFDVKIGRRDMCPNCAAYLHCCFNCQHWDPNVHNQCRENQGEFIRDRAEGNFCLYFDFKVIGEDRASESDKARLKLEALFGGGAAGGGAAGGGAAASTPTAQLTPEEKARKRLEDLFKK